MTLVRIAARAVLDEFNDPFGYSAEILKRRMDALRDALAAPVDEHVMLTKMLAGSRILLAKAEARVDDLEAALSGEEAT